MAMPFKATVITPEATILDTEVTGAQVPVFDGLVGILQHRAPLLAKLGTGILRLEAPGGAQRFLVSGGYARMVGDQLTILTTEAVPAAQVTDAMISREEDLLRSLGGTDKKSMEQRQAVQARITAMRSAQAA